ncbi:MAG: Stk1 family PASTA domain-containing Ser/Thr kinase, partial [Actinomycetes bacterium]
MTAEPMRVGGRYELGEPLGRGGMAEVRRAVDSRLGRQVAVKQLRADLATDPTFQARFRREAQSAAGLNHPNIVAVYDTGEEPDPVTGVGIPYIVMELVQGSTLRDLLREGRKLLPERALELTAGVLDALSYSHKAGIVHRDIKPANVMLTRGGGIKVMDFGIARAVADTSATVTQTAAVIGTAQYLSPEQARGETVDARSDIYSAGCLLYELLVGRPPFMGESPVSVAYQHVREAPVPPSRLDPAISADIDAVTLKALAKDPDDRYQSAREMKADLTRVLAGEQVTAAALPPAAGPDTAPPWGAPAVAAATPAAAPAAAPAAPAYSALTGNPVTVRPGTLSAGTATL